MFRALKNKMENYQKRKELEKERLEEEEEKTSKIIREEIDKFFNTILPTFLLLDYNRANLISILKARTSGGSCEIIGTEETVKVFNDFYNKYLGAFIKLLEKKGISLKGKEEDFVYSFLFKLKNKNYDICKSEYGFYFEGVTTLEDAIIKYIETMNWDTHQIRDVGKLSFFSELLFNNHIIDKCYPLTELDGIVQGYYKMYRLENMIKNANSKFEQNSSITIEHIDLMNGQEFEVFLANLFTNLGYTVETTKATGDQGVDLLLYKNDQIIAVQAKCYSNTVGNNAIQEVVAGQKFYNTNKTMVVTNNYFTNSAKELANTTGTMLWNRDKLIAMIDLIY